ncbi:MAG: hypothetical protein AB7F22_25400 [Reyranella sp.]|uniref:hypothetical protein n=1 Tax=Reyranella sp. TaxID=1929291 RepID=UPI003D0A34F5
MRLATLQSVQEAMGVDNGRDGENAVLAALEAATLDLAARLRCGTFDLATCEDDFRICEGATAFALSRGFVHAGSTVWAAQDRGDLRPSARDITDKVDIDRERGVVSAFCRRSEQPLWLRVSYQAGFATDDGETYRDVPSWLSLAAQLAARIALNAHPSFVTNLSTTDASSLQSQLDRIVQSKMRYLPWAQIPRASRAL